MRFDILTLFPEMIVGIMNSSILKRAIEQGLLEVHIHNFREYATNKHATVDDYAYGGGAGMLIQVAPIHLALQQIPGMEQALKLLTSPSGTVWNQALAEEYAKRDQIVIICGHYEGIDARILDYIDEEISLGDYVLTGGEIPACLLVDCIARLVPGVISEASLAGESFTMGLLEYPQYTRPPVYDGKRVPEVLLSGHHANIVKWKKYQALKKTYYKRPDLLEKYALDETDQKLLREIKNEKR